MQNGFIVVGDSPTGRAGTAPRGAALKDEGDEEEELDEYERVDEDPIWEQEELDEYERVDEDDEDPVWELSEHERAPPGWDYEHDRAPPGWDYELYPLGLPL